MNVDQYKGLVSLLGEIRDRLPVPDATPAPSLTGVITLPAEPPVGTKLQDVDDETWRRESDGWHVNNSSPAESWSTVLKYAPLVIVSAIVSTPAMKSTDAILDSLRAAATDWLENDFGHVYGQTVLDILDGK